MSDQELNNTPEEATTEVTNQPQAVAEEQAASQQPQQNVLLGAISYSDQEAFDKFLMSMDLNQAIFVLISAVNNAQQKGAYNLDEAELVARSIKTIKKNSAPAPVADASVETDSSTNESEG